MKVFLCFLPVGLLLNMLGLDLEVEEVEVAILTVLVVADLEMIDGRWGMVDGCFEQLLITAGVYNDGKPLAISDSGIYHISSVISVSFHYFWFVCLMSHNVIQKLEAIWMTCHIWLVKLAQNPTKIRTHCCIFSIVNACFLSQKCSSSKNRKSTYSWEFIFKSQLAGLLEFSFWDS